MTTMTTTTVQDTCGCCQGVEPITPEPIVNRPGLDAIAYRVGTQPDFLETMQARLSAMSVSEGEGEPETRPLLRLTTREADDASIALLDSWAYVADVLTFYQERIANEGYLRTATERRSVLELARLVGYALKPGVASTVYLAYTIDETHTEPTIIEPGARSQSIPGPGESPQSFETVEAVEARAKWNVLQPRLSRPQTYAGIQTAKPDGALALYLRGVATNLKPNDVLLLLPNGSADLTQYLVAYVKDATPDLASNRTKVTFGVASAAGAHAPAAHAIGEAGIAQTYQGRVETTLQTALDARPSGQTADKIAEMLNERLIALPENVTFKAVDDFVASLIDEVQATTLPPNATVLSKWRQALLDALQQAQSEAQTAIHAAANPDAGSPGAGGDNDELLNVIRGLSTPASTPPRNALRLDRALAQTFDRRADGGLQVLNAVRPDLRANLPAALANVQATPHANLQVYAFRTQAGVYGPTAPKRIVTDDNGKVIGTTEWPIDGTQVTEVALVDEGHESLSVQGAWCTQTGSFLTFTFSVDGAEDKTYTLGDSVTISVSSSSKFDSSGIVITLSQFNDKKETVYKQQIVYKRATAGEFSRVIKVSVTTDGFDDIVDMVMPERKTLVTMNLRAYELSTDYGPNQQPHYIVHSETPRPPTPWNVIPLDAPVDGIAPDSLALVQRHGTHWIPATVKQSKTVARNDYNFPAKVTELTLDNDWLTTDDWYLSDIRDTAVFAKSELLELADEPVTEPICGADQWIELDDLYSDLKPGRWLIVAGDRTDIKDANENTVENLKSAELVMLDAVRHDVVKPKVISANVPKANDVQGDALLPGDSNHTYIKLAKQLNYCYRRDKVSIYANVVKATHGETRDESLGGGDGSQSFQSFALKQSPLTFVPSLIPAGAETTLKVYVNAVRWRETDSLALSQPNNRHYVTKIDDDARTTVIFGAGEHGARLPTGIENIRAIYRQGIGKAGNVQAEQISLLVSRPLGVKAVINPIRASGGADKESKDSARKNAPLAVTALDRLVSVQDYADFARSFAGIGKSVAARISDGSRQVVHVTIAGADDIPIDEVSDLYQNLLRALREFGDADVPVRLAVRELLLVAIQAKVRAKVDYLWEPVVANIRRALYSVFSFERRELGQDVTLSEVISAIQGVRGVDYVDVDALGGIPEKKLDADGKTRRLLTPKEIALEMKKLLVEQGVVSWKVAQQDLELMHLYPGLQPGTRPRQRITAHLAMREGQSIRPAQLAFLSQAVPDLLVINRIQSS